MDQQQIQLDLETFKSLRPYLRTLLAFIVYLRYNSFGMAGSYKEVENFLVQLQRDIETNT